MRLDEAPLGAGDLTGDDIDLTKADRLQVTDRHLGGSDPVAAGNGGVDHHLVQHRADDAAVGDAGVALVRIPQEQPGLGAALAPMEVEVEAGRVIRSADEAVVVNLEFQTRASVARGGRFDAVGNRRHCGGIPENDPARRFAMADFTPRIRQLSDPADPLLPEWLALYERAFPPEERVPGEEHLRELRPDSDAVLLAAEDEDGKLLGLARYDLYDHAAYLYYLAVDDAVRSLGLGSAIYQEILRRLDPELTGMVFEVEHPDHAADPELARRRIRFYQRLGAKLLRGIHYLQEIPGQPPVPMHLMVHPFRLLTAEQGLFLAEELFDFKRTQEPLALE